MPLAATSLLKLNLGCGQNPPPGYINVDKFGEPDVRCDLEQFPWPWEDSSIDEVLMQHVLEHLGASAQTYLAIIKELYRVCRDGAIVHIIVPHPRHDDFLGDPTHVRAITAEGWLLFSKARNEEWKERRCSNTPLAFYLDVDFEIVQAQMRLDDQWLAKIKTGRINQRQLEEAIRGNNNVVQEIRFDARVIKPAGAQRLIALP